MQYIAVATPSFDAIELFDRITAQVGDAPEGMLARYAGTADDGGLRVVTLWESQAHADRFFRETLGPAVRRELGSAPAAPRVTGISVSRQYVRTPAAAGAGPIG